MPTSSYLSKVVYTTSGTTDVFSVTIPYLDRDDITVTVNGVAKTFTWLSSNQIKMDGGNPAAAQTLVIQRTTDIAVPKVDYADASTLTERDLDTTAQQNLYLIQELQEQISALKDIIVQITTGSGNLPPVDTSDNGKILQVVTGAWALVAPVSVTLVSDSIVDGTNKKIQKKTRVVKVIETQAESAATDVHTGGGCS
jgi:hypothetical protein